MPKAECDQALQCVCCNCYILLQRCMTERGQLHPKSPAASMVNEAFKAHCAVCSRPCTLWRGPSGKAQIGPWDSLSHWSQSLRRFRIWAPWKPFIWFAPVFPTRRASHCTAKSWTWDSHSTAEPNGSVVSGPVCSWQVFHGKGCRFGSWYCSLRRRQWCSAGGWPHVSSGSWRIPRCSQRGLQTTLCLASSLSFFEGAAAETEGASFARSCSQKTECHHSAHLLRPFWMCLLVA